MIKKVGIIGAGNMGSGIAQKVAQSGLDVVMVDMEDRFVKKGMDSIRDTLAEAVKRKIFTPGQTEEILGRITGTTDLGMVSDTDLVIEVVFEDMEVKKGLFRELDGSCEPKTVLASNTSSFSITELASAVGRKDRFLGLHFFYHPAKNRLLEVIPGEETSLATLKLGSEFSNLIGKTGIGVKDAPGFAVNRFFVPWLNEATRLREEGVTVPTIDETAKRVFKIGMGPFLLMNVTGVPIAYHSTVSLGKELGDFYGPSNCLQTQFESGAQWDLEGVMQDDKVQEVEERLLGCVFTVACHLVEEGVASMEDTDRGAKIGLRWAKGPFEMMNRYGMERAYDIVARFIADHPGLAMPGILAEQRKKNEPWHFRLVDLEVAGGIATILINRPEAMNAINEEVVRQLEKRFEQAESDPGVKAIVLDGAGKAFIAGADIGFFVKNIKKDGLDDIVEFTRYGHEVLARIDNSDKLVIAKLDGLALGGGVEIALAADCIVATEKGSLGFPETGIGIYPGLGGTQRTPRYIGKELAKYLVLTGRTLDANTAKDIGLVEYVVPSAEVDARIRNLVESGEVLTKSSKGPVHLGEKLEGIKSYFTDDNLPKLLDKSPDLDETGQKMAKTIGFKAPIAIRLANMLIDEGGKVDLKEGLQMELDHLKEIFSTKDALEGLTSVLERRRPSFTGS